MKHVVLVRLLSILLVVTSSAVITEESEKEYYMIAVSGGLQDGFPGRDKLDYITETERSRATLIGTAFVRGYKSYLDVMEEDYREYMPLEQSTVNPNVFASGCYEHANEYFVYLVDARQVFQVLLHEPRFLSITPDTGLTEIKFSSPLVQDIAEHEISLDDNNEQKNWEQVAFPLVTAVHFQSTSLIETPHVYERDGSKVTNYPESLALWAGADNKDRLEYISAYEHCLYNNPNPKSCDMESHESFQRYWTTIRQAIQKVRDERAATKNSSSSSSPQPNSWKCQKRVRFGTSKETTRMQRAYTAKSFQDMLQTINNKETSIHYDIDFEKGQINIITPGYAYKNDEL